MTDRAFSINENGRSIRCRIYAGSAQTARVVIYGHGLAGHKENRAAHRFAEKFISKHSDAAVIVFDWPCHGEDALKNLTLSDCDLYLNTVIEYARSHFGGVLFGYATSFGGYLFLKYILEHGDPFAFTALRNPAVDMGHIMRRTVMTEEDERLLAKGKPVMAGFDRKIRITADLLKALEENDILVGDFSEYSDAIMIIQGMKDEVVDAQTVKSFADANDILLLPVEKADHRFSDPSLMDESISSIIELFELGME